MLSILVSGSIALGAVSHLSDSEEALTTTIMKGRTEIELPPSVSVPNITPSETLLENIKEEGQKIKQVQYEELRVKVEQLRLEQARLAQLEEERKAKEELERKLQEEKRKQEQQVQVASVQPSRGQNTQVTQSSVKTITVNASYYTANCEGCIGITKTGVNVKNTIYYKGMRIVAVDPNVIPLYSILEVSTPNGTFKAIALDTGGAIKGNKLDILVSDKQTAINLGRHTATVKIIGKGE